MSETIQAYANAIKVEHRELAAMAHRLQTSLQTAMAEGWRVEQTRDIVGRLEQLERGLTAHFCREEQGGFLEEATAAAPRLGCEMEELLGEHKELLASIRALLATAQDLSAARSPVAGAWEPFCHELTATLAQLLHHEARENALLQRAFNVEIEV